MWLKTLWDIVKVLPALIGLIREFLSMLDKRREAKRAEQVDEARKQMDQAQTPEEIWKANEEVTRNLP
ncbi:hypothetical protein D3C87_124990 [compost metagenome]